MCIIGCAHWCGHIFSQPFIFLGGVGGLGGGVTVWTRFSNCPSVNDSFFIIALIAEAKQIYWPWCHLEVEIIIMKANIQNWCKRHNSNAYPVPYKSKYLRKSNFNALISMQIRYDAVKRYMQMIEFRKYFSSVLQWNLNDFTCLHFIP